MPFQKFCIRSLHQSDRCHVPARRRCTPYARSMRRIATYDDFASQVTGASTDHCSRPGRRASDLAPRPFRPSCRPWRRPTSRRSSPMRMGSLAPSTAGTPYESRAPSSWQGIAYQSRWYSSLGAGRRFMWYQPHHESSAILYADAFFVTDGNRHKAGHVPSTASTSPQHRSDNGWGFVLRIGELVYYDMGTVAEEHLAAFTTRKAFIYALEILAQVIAATAFGSRLPAMWIAFIDNTAGQAALLKGYGKDPAVNGVLAAFWATAARHDWRPAFERVVSKANISDAVSRRDLTRARRDGWTRLHTPSTKIIGILAHAAQDLQYACAGAADDLVEISNQWAPF